jgi:putative tryptophan/tyrosine transport system substrate-binding protein
MRRREFITLLGNTTLAWPLSARAQQSERMRRIGVLTGVSADDSENKASRTTFEQALQQLGWTQGRNVRIDTRFGGGDAAIIRRQAEELVALAPDVIVSTGSSATGELLRVTHTVPIVFVIVPDPVGSGFVDSLSQPGGNATGFMQFEYASTACYCSPILPMMRTQGKLPSLRSSTGCQRHSSYGTT